MSYYGVAVHFRVVGGPGLAGPGLVICAILSSACIRQSAIVAALCSPLHLRVIKVHGGDMQLGVIVSLIREMEFVPSRSQPRGLPSNGLKGEGNATAPNI